MSHINRSAFTTISDQSNASSASILYQFGSRTNPPSKLNAIHLAILSSYLLLSSCSKSPEPPPTPQTSSVSRPEPLLAANEPSKKALGCTDGNTVKAEVVALEQIITYNRFGAFNPAGMVYALARDVVDSSCTLDEEKADWDNKNQPDKNKKKSVKACHVDDLKDKLPMLAGNVRLRQDKRPRPLVLRVNEGECLTVTFWNLLSPLPSVHSNFARADFPAGGVQRHAVQSEVPKGISLTDLSTPPRDPSLSNGFPLPAQEEPDYPTTRAASIHVNGLDYVDISADGANVGNNKSSLAEPGTSKTYKWYARQEGGYFFYSAGALAGGEGDGGQLGLGLFGSVNVEPKGSVWYRSQVAHNDLIAAKAGKSSHYDDLNYEKLSILDAQNQIVHSDLNAIIYQTDKTQETPDVCSKRSPGSSCGMSFREFTTIFHDENKVFQAFAELSDENNPLSAIADGMAVNYGSSGVGSAVLANKKKMGPSKDCPECKVEEFFLSSWVNGDPAMIVQRDAKGEAVKALYDDDPSNVHHSYLGDPVRFRTIHAGPKETHVFHLHAHQWLQDKNDPNSNYLDSQTISPGSSYTYDIQYGGGGNRNLTVGDAIFHCHLYPHFAAGMWEMWRNHDVFEDGKPGLYDKNKPDDANKNHPSMRNLPDYELAKYGGSPNPAIVPIPDFPLAPLPTKEFPGYPFYIAAEPGHRPPQPPMDMAINDHSTTNTDKWLDGGLPRHIITAGKLHELSEDPKKKADEINALLKGKGDVNANRASRYIAQRTWTLNSDPSNLILAEEIESATLKTLPQCGSLSEVLAMAYHAGWDRETIVALKKGGQPVNADIDKIGEKLWKVCQGEFKAVLEKLPDDFMWQAKSEATAWPKAHSIHNDTNPNPQSSLATMSVLWEGRGFPTVKATHPKDHLPNPAIDMGTTFRVNGYAPAAGAPYAEPCPKRYFEEKTNNGKPSPVNRDKPRLYKAAYIQFDMTVNKYGWHDPQARMPVLEEDAADTLSGKRLPEPLFFRANSGDCIQFQATNLIPSVLNLDDFQVYTPTDTIGQHIHLVKFDVTSSDGSANGWNYEDGTFSPDEIRERIKASQTSQKGQVKHWDGKRHLPLTPKTYKLPRTSASDVRGQCSGNPEEDNKQHPWCGAQTTVQRWWADPVLNHLWVDNALRTVFTHDHYGPSSHQQHGFYGALIVEPKETVWTKLSASPADVDPTQDKCLDTTLSGSAEKPCRSDGGPTSYAANIGLPMSHPHKDEADHQHVIKREYNLAFADFAILYNADLRPVNPPSRQADLMLPHVVRDGLKPKPEGISTEDPGTRLLNYRNEPIPLRIAEEDHSDDEVKEPSSLEYHQKTTLRYGKGSLKTEGDMANVFSSLIHSSPEISKSTTDSKQYASERIRKLTNNTPNEIIDTHDLTTSLPTLLEQQVDKTKTFNTLINENEPWRLDGDPSTPVLPGYAGDKLNIHLIQGSQEEQHVFSMNGLKWLAEPESKNSGYMNGQQIGISEHFEMEAKLPNTNMLTDYWVGSPSVENNWDGMWGLVRSMGGQKVFLPEANVQSRAVGANNAEDPNKSERRKKLRELFMSGKLNINQLKGTGSDKAEKILAKLAVLPKNLDKKIEDMPDLHKWQKADPEIDFNSNKFNKKLLEQFPSDKAKREKIISLLKTNNETGVLKDVYEYYDTFSDKLKDLLNKEGGSQDLVTFKKYYARFFNEEIWNMQPCPLSAYKDSNNHMKHVVAVLAEDILKEGKDGKDGKKISYNEFFKITDQQGIAFIELDSEWVAEQQTKAKNAQINNPEDYAKQIAKGKSYPLSTTEIIEKLKLEYQNDRAIEPLVLRANAGECIQVTLHNLLPESFLDGSNDNQNGFDFWSYNQMPPIVSGFNFNQVQMSSTINLIPQLVAYDVKEMGGGNIGANTSFDPTSKTKGLPGCRKTTTDGSPDFSDCDNNIAEYIWYAGNRQVLDTETYDKYEKEQKLAIECPVKTEMRDGKGYLCHTPIEFGVVSLRSFGDVIKQASHGAVGALVIEPKGSMPKFPFSSSRITADIKDEKTGKVLFREFVVVFQDDLSLHQNGQPMPNHRMADDAEDTGQKGFNYHSEPLWARNGVGTSGADFNTLNQVDYSNTLSSLAANPGCSGSACGDPDHMVFKATAGSNIRFRLVHPNGHSRQHAFTLYGHNWDHHPWMNESTELATPEQKELRTAIVGTVDGIGPGRHFNILTQAGGINSVPGDYLFRVQEQFQFQGGMWGILRVNEPGKE